MSIVIGAALAGCQDPTIEVRIVVPTEPHDYAGELATLSISVLATDYSCDDAAYGLIDEGVIALAEVAGATAESGDGLAIDGVPRLGPKLFVAEGRDAMEERVVAGCTPLGDVEDDVIVEIVTEAIGDLVVAPHFADQPAPATLDVIVDDGFLAPAPLPGRGVRWEVLTCPAAEVTSGSADPTDDAGATTVELTAPPGYGPRPIHLRARWAEPQPAVVSTFQGPQGVIRPIGASCPAGLEVATAAWQPFRPAGEIVAIAGLARGGGAAHLYAAAWDGTSSIQGCSADVGDVDTFAVIRGPAGVQDSLVVVDASLIHVYLISSDGVGGLQVTEQASRAWANPTTEPPRAIVPVRACGRDSGEQDFVLVQTSDDDVLAFRNDGMPWPDNPLAFAIDAMLPALAIDGNLPEILVAGCMAGAGGVPPAQGVILEVQRMLIDDPSTLRPRFLVVDATGYGLGFVPIAVPSFGAVAFTPIREAEDPYLLGGTIEPSGPKVVRWRLTLVGETLQLREDRVDDALGPPASLAYGDLDGDDVPDTVWGLVDAIAGGIEESRLQVSLGCGEGEGAINGISTTLATGAAAVFLAREADGTSDLMIGGSNSAVFVDTD
jgi:hypothetical protein